MNNYYENITEDERKRQIAEARRLARISVQSVGEEHAGGNKSKNKTEKSGRLKGHEVLLDAIRANRQVCEFCFLDNEIIYGTVEHSDTTTVSIHETNAKGDLVVSVDNGFALRVIFKASLKYFTPFRNNKGA